MKKRRIKLVWGASKVIRGSWYFGLFGLYSRADGQHEGGLAISVRGLLLWGLGLSVAGYVAAAAALFSFWQRNPYCLLTYSDAFFYPVRRAEVRAKKGQALIAEGQELLKADKWFDGSRLLRQGLALYPADLNARLGLAKFYLLVNQRTLAVNLLREALGREFPGRPYLQNVFELAEQGEDYGLAVTVADRYLALLKPEAGVDRRWLSIRKFNALMAAQRPAEALVFAESEGPGDVGSEHRVLALVELGRASEAVELLAAWQQQPGADQLSVRRLQVRAFREAGRKREMERAIEELRLLAPGDPRQAVYGIVQRALAGDAESAGAALADYVFRFGGSAQNLEMAAAPLAEIGNRPLFERCVAAATERGFALRNFRVLQAQLLVHLGEWTEASRVLALMRPAAGQVLPAGQQVWTEWMEHVVEAAGSPTEASQRAMLELLRGRPWPMKLYRQCIDALVRAGRWETAREVIAMAGALFPESRWVTQQKDRVTKELAARQTAEAPLPTAATARTQGEAAFFGLLDRLLGERGWDQADDLIHEARTRRPPPVWLDKRDGDLRLADIRIGQGRKDPSAMLAAARLYLNGDAARARRTVEVAQEFFAAGDKPAVVALTQAVLQRTPEFAQAKRLLAEASEGASAGPPKDAVTNVPAAQRMTEVPTPPVMAAPAIPETEPAFFEQLDGGLRDRRWDQADGLIRAARAARPPPAWLDKRDGDLRLAEVRIGQARKEPLAMLSAAKLYLNGDVARARRMLEVAREIFDAGDKPAAIALMQAVLQRTPEFAQAKRLLAEWTAGTPPGK